MRYRRSICRVTLLVTFTAFAFYLFFAGSKLQPFRDVNPFNDDPYDAFGWFGFQVALLTAVVTYARALRLRESQAQAQKTRLILRGNIVVLAAILISLAADVAAGIFPPLPPSYWGAVLNWALLGMLAMNFACVAAVATVFRHVPLPEPPLDLTPADGLDDLWILVRIPVTKAQSLLPATFVAWVQNFTSDRFFAHLSWTNPRSHPWRFGCAAGLVAGMGLTVAHLQEGLPPTLAIGLFIAAIFIGVELTATVLGFLLLGGYLGLRPSWRGSRRAGMAAQAS